MWVEGPAAFGPIQPFERIELSPLTIVIGPNGAGKTHFLLGLQQEAILSPHKNNYVAPDEYSSHAGIVYASGADTSGNFSMPDAGIAIEDIMNNRVSAFDAQFAAEAAYKQSVESLREIEELSIRQTGKSIKEQFGELEEMYFGCSLDVESNLYKPNAGSSSDLAKKVIREADRIYSHISGYLPPMRDGNRSPIFGGFDVNKIFSMDAESFRRYLNYDWGSVFANNIADIFREYRDRKWRNQVQRHTDSDSGTKLAYSPEDMQAAFGTPPWELVSKQLKKFGLPYIVVPPSDNPTRSVRFVLQRDGSQEQLNVDQLSAGERIIMRLALAGFRMEDARLNLRRAGLILLDELDASLHPDNVRRLLGAVQTGFIDGLGSDCILTTHSPSTVALAPEGEFLEIDQESRKPVKISKQQAMDRLTAGLPMLSVNYMSRRQVFTESDVDMKHYSALYDIMRPLVDAPRTLSFIGSGSKGSCAFVREMVEHMVQHNNETVYGVVDWDLGNEPTDRVKVIGLGEYYAKDNILLHPLLIAALLMKADQAAMYTNMKYSQIMKSSNEDIQRVCDAIMGVVKLPHGGSKESRKTSFYKGIEVYMPVAYMEMNGHAWEKAILQAIEPLGRKYPPNGPLITDIIRKVISDIPELCPTPVFDVFRSLAGGEELESTPVLH